jgi:integrase
LESLKDVRDKAIFSVLFYSWCRVSALINLTVADYYERGGTRWLRFQEKRGKEHEVPVHSKAKEAVDLWLERSDLASNPSAPLFPSFGKKKSREWRSGRNDRSCDSTKSTSATLLSWAKNQNDVNEEQY